MMWPFAALSNTRRLSECRHAYVTVASAVQCSVGPRAAGGKTVVGQIIEFEKRAGLSANCISQKTWYLLQRTS